MTPPRHISKKLKDLGYLDDHNIALIDTALLLACIDRPGASIDPYQRHLDALVTDVITYVQGGSEPITSLTGQAEALVQVIVKHHGYFGADDAFDDIDGANLMRCIDQRSGLPVTLALIYLHVGRAMGWAMEAIDFPGRVLIRLDHPDGRVIMDPFDGGATMEAPVLRALLKSFAGQDAELTPDRFQAMSNRRILVRLVENIKVRHLKAGELEAALTSIETMLMFAPKLAQLWREAGVIHARLDHLPEAVDALEQFLNFDTQEQSRYAASVLLQELRGRLQT